MRRSLSLGIVFRHERGQPADGIGQAGKGKPDAGRLWKAGRQFAKRTRLDRLVGHVQKFADRHSGLFLGIVLAIVIGCFVINAYHFTKAYQLRKAQTESSRTPEDSIREALDNAHTMIPIKESEEDGTVQED